MQEREDTSGRSGWSQMTNLAQQTGRGNTKNKQEKGDCCKGPSKVEKGSEEGGASGGIQRGKWDSE